MRKHHQLYHIKGPSRESVLHHSECKDNKLPSLMSMRMEYDKKYNSEYQKHGKHKIMAVFEEHQNE